MRQEIERLRERVISGWNTAQSVDQLIEAVRADAIITAPCHCEKCCLERASR